MADLAASDILVTPQETDFMTFNKVVMSKIKFGDGAKTIPAGGIPLPDLVSFGLHKGIKRGHCGSRCAAMSFGLIGRTTS